MDPLRLGGLASNMDTEAIIQKLMSLENRPLIRANQQESVLTGAKSDWATIGSALRDLKAAADTLASATTWTATTVSSSDSTNLAASSSGTPTAATYSMTITQLAQAESVQSKVYSAVDTALGLQGTITVGKKSVTLATTDSLDGVRDKLNAAGAGVTASVLQVSPGQYTLLVQANATGTANAITFGDDATYKPLQSLGLLTGGGAKNVVQAARDATFTLNGIAFTRSSNTVTDAVSGVTLTLKGVNTSGLTLTVGTDTAGMASQVQGFATKVNAVVDKIKQYTGKGGPLEGDAAVIGLQRRLTTLVMSTVSGLSGSLKTLAQIGVTFDRDGHLNVDAAKLNTQLSANAAGVAALFTTSGSGIGPALSGFLKVFTQAGGTLDSMSKSFDRQVQAIEDYKTGLTQMLKIREDSLRREFTNMEKVVSTLRNQGNWLTMQLAGVGVMPQQSGGSSLRG